MGKRIERTDKTFIPTIEEWTYYNPVANTKEFYRFKRGKLVDYKTEVVP
jgi:hypothetical protein